LGRFKQEEKMKVYLRVLPALLVLMLAASIAAVPASARDEGHFDRTLTVSGSLDLDVQTGSGSIKVRKGEPGKVEIHGTIHASTGWHVGDVEGRIHTIETNPPIEQNGNTIRVGHIEDHDLLQNISISYELTVPADTKLRSSSGSGDQAVDGVRGTVDATSGSGSLRLSNIGAETHARTGSGEIELNSIGSGAHASAGSGTIHAIGIAGAFSASSGSGDVRFEQTAAGDVEISTGSGSVDAKGVKGALQLKTGSGSIVVQGDPTGEWRIQTGSGSVTAQLPQQASFDLRARTSSGRIESSHEITVQGSISPRELQGKVHGGGVLVDLSTSSGNIKIL
jgi:DUF4097 and DUF4098 domain-containing protein YvlB